MKKTLDRHSLIKSLGLIPLITPSALENLVSKNYEYDMRDFLNAAAHNDSSMLSSSLDASMESHPMAFKAEESRKTRQTMKIEITK